MSYLRARFFLFVCALFIAVSAHSDDNTTASEMFESGVTAFNAKQFEQALEQFERARDAGSDDPMLLYNIAVCHFKLEQWAPANRAFAELHEREPGDWLVLYNLAVTEKKLGRLGEAQVYFLEVAVQNEYEQLALLAMRQYDMLTLNKPERGDSQWLGLLSAGYGLDDNVIDPSDETASKQRDRFLEAMASASWYSSSDLTRAWTFDAMAYISRYQDVSDYDIGLFALGGKKHLPVGRNHVYLGAGVERIQLGSDPYQFNWELEVGANVPIAKRQYFNAQYRFQKLRSLDEQFDPFQGTNQRIDLDFGGRVGRLSSWKIRYRFDDDNRDDRDDLELYGTYTSFSALRNSLYARWSWAASRWDASLSADYRHSRNKDDNIFYADDFSLQAERREDNRYLLSAHAAWFFVPNWALNADYSYTRNDSNIELYEFERNLFTVSLGWQF